ncbi:polysaccharide deacetylase family protein [Sphingomonas sp. M1-B02]|uniref:polysaccharide deacetylase family protein n=1 Tax=Sphingomonas sp. M1-B02 TaxID=3114300 RepID=UPI00223EB5E4|nr:polysaccharide deacetylase family protein [Sphingomonas sp. S6-11]UZK67319.1 polysaccharide deacetylase family protein [Sphingomonas sp. S6-11]
MITLLWPVVIGLACSASGAAAPPPTRSEAPFLIAITVDDLPAHGPLPATISRAAIAQAYVAVLKAHRVPGAFGFVNAARIDREPGSEAVLDIWRKAGYPLGNHSFSHLNIGRAASFDAWKTDVEKGEPAVARRMRGRDWHFFRFPNLARGAGEQQAAAAKFLEGRGYRLADVSVAFGDWVYSDAYVRCLEKGDQASIVTMKAQYLAGVDDGIAHMKAVSQRIYGRVIPQVLLTHLGAWSVATMREVMAKLDAAGAKYVTLPQAQSDPAYAAAAALPGGGSIMERTAKARNIDLSSIAPLRVGVDVKQLCR